MFVSSHLPIVLTKTYVRHSQVLSNSKNYFLIIADGLEIFNYNLELTFQNFYNMDIGPSVNILQQ